MNARADADTKTLRISLDTKATVHVGDYSRGGRSRGAVAVKALDLDMCPKVKLVPGGILEPVTGRSFLFFGTHHKTSDFLVDGIILWWEERKQELSGLKHRVINLDNGPECNGHRSQFLLRMTEFADRTGLCIRLVYYPPYHSKYNGIERYWAGLEKSWNGHLLTHLRDSSLSKSLNFCCTRLLFRKNSFKINGHFLTLFVVPSNYSSILISSGFAPMLKPCIFEEPK
ncbi:MAG: hypothetical protein HOP36_03990, partial [Methyloglobulus sp.]|nr:hypothetical protein [Methyloglobulus sp.]